MWANLGSLIPDTPDPRKMAKEARMKRKDYVELLLFALRERAEGESSEVVQSLDKIAEEFAELAHVSEWTRSRAGVGVKMTTSEWQKFSRTARKARLTKVEVAEILLQTGCVREEAGEPPIGAKVRVLHVSRDAWECVKDFRYGKQGISMRKAILAWVKAQEEAEAERVANGD